MSNPPYSRIVTIALAALAAFLVMAPAASAQTGSKFSVTGASVDLQQIKPDVERAKLTVDWIFQLENVAQTPVTVVNSAFTIEWTPKCDNPNVQVTGSFSQLVTVSQSGAAPGKAVGPSTFFVTVNQDAPGETQIRCTITGTPTAVSSQGAAAPQPSSGIFTVAADYLGLISVNVPKTIKQAAPQKQITYDLEVSNLGNSRNNIDFALTGETPSGWDPVVPSRIVLESRAQGGQETTKNVGFTISTPYKNGWNNKDTTFVMDITPTSTKVVEKTGAPVSVTVLARVRGVYVPTLEPLMLVGAVLGAALVVRLQRRDE